MLLNRFAFTKPFLKIMLHNWPCMLLEQEVSSKGSLGRIGILFFLLALAFLALATCASVGINALCYTISSAGRCFNGSTGSCGNGRGNLELIEIAIFAGEDRGCVLHICLEKLSDAFLNICEASGQIAERDNDLMNEYLSASSEVRVK